MRQRIVDAILNEGTWLPLAMFLGFVAAAHFARKRFPEGWGRERVLAAMNLFYGTLIGTMAFGHLLAVTVKAVQGANARPLWLMYLLGIVLAVPAWWLAARAGRVEPGSSVPGTLFACLNAWLGLFLLALGFHNLPLAAPAALNLAYQFHARRAVGWAIVSIAVAANLALFAGALVFWASGQTFEQFSGQPPR